MKKFLLFIIFMFFISAVHTQNKKHEIDVGIGLWSSNLLLSTFSDIIITIITQEGISSKDGQSYGTYHLSYHYAVWDRISIGGVFAYDYEKTDAYFMNMKRGNFYNRFFSLAAEADYKYINNEKFKLYSLIGVGGTLYNQTYKENINDRKEDHTSLFFNFQVTPVGIKLGSDFGGFLELGFGYKGILTIGAFARF